MNQVWKSWDKNKDQFDKIMKINKVESHQSHTTTHSLNKKKLAWSKST